MDNRDPAVSVIVIVYNDADRLPTAVRSVLDQTLHSVEVVIVDDHSPDRSFEVAQELAAAHPDRIRAFQLPENSGAGGEPRNLGITKARGRYVMFLDSDDVLELNACRNMLEAAERTGSDMVSGLCVRTFLDSRHGKIDKWYEWLYRTTRVLDSVLELPDLFVFDTLSTNKCYRRDFLLDNDLRFPKGLLYEDLLFAARAYLAAQRITLIPNEVYYWHVRENAKKKSVTNRRHEMSNFTDRIEIHRRIDALLRERGYDELRLAKDVKFLKHDLVLHLRDLPFRDQEFRHEFARIARGYLAGIDDSAYDALLPIHAICAYLLLEEDWPNLATAVDTLLNRSKLSSPLAERDGRIYWCSDHLYDERARRILDVTELGYHTKSVDGLFLRNALTSYDQDAKGIRVAGSIVNPLGLIPADAKLSASLEFKARRKSLQQFTFPVGRIAHAGDHLEWSAEAPLASKLRPLGFIDALWDVRLVLKVNGKKTSTRITVGDVPLEGSGRLRARPRLTRLVSDTLEPEVSSRGHLAFQLVAAGALSRRSRALIDQALEGAPGTVAKAGVRKAKKVRRNLKSGDTKLRAYHEIFMKLPVRKRTVVFESHLGRQYSDSPRAIYEEMRRQGLDFTAVWSYDKSPEGFPKDAELVKRWSWPYLRALAQAEFWVDNQSYPVRLAKRKETTYIQTWHGSALKKMGFDSPEFRTKTKAQQADQQRVLDRFDHFLVRTEHDVRTLVPAFRLPDSKIVRSGYPRNDSLVAAAKAEAEGGGRVRGALAEKLGIPDDRKILLYAPTFRSSPDGAVQKFEPPFDVEEFAERFGDRYVLLMRSHYLNNVVLPPSVRGRVIDVSGIHDVTPLYLLADALITDYSSVMFDYALLGRPMLFFAYDLDDYVNGLRGTYFDLVKHAPGPVVERTGELYSALDDLDAVDRDWADARKRFVAEFGEYDRGDAARQIVDTFFRRGGQK
ncbi:bifunctional glycosyltransferase/CDP-glycerol:glycerophosphate glycerophosphotransferase [Actinacidiphila bryophytorum]|uniref:bifunctional glycosyltransferase/CDP-glycerol:glycerophosphate glycerophosphotransferase n=1 Tax=Actinacidiphila bryophytorum TaxID=1436133 RepID=UPI002176E0B0|nr:bifunctional glycosyltransferase family 2 protein/CDP-glycerol:glycerophosphate glycerophosphotransferase [Actinacidiphila bryophytorum]UWE13641.1 bifunctional glycosyltransferase family 2 protein/CDP-glycerol:glycerophosphate glycerophosphotransferase [Actinacidiphila bryophytorum]